MLKRTLPAVFGFVLLANLAAVAPSRGADGQSALPIRQALDAYLDGRWLPKGQADKATAYILQKLREAGCTAEEVEQMLRGGRASYETPKVKGRLLMVPDLQCEHVDYKTSMFFYIPKSYDPAKAAPLLMVGHGGNGAMSADYAKKAALVGIILWLPVVEREGMILAAPLSERGWGGIGNSILFSAM